MREMKRVRSAQMNSRWLWGILCVLAACEPLPPEPKQNGQTPEFTVLSATPPIGSIDFSLSESGHLEGALVLQGAVAPTLPIRVSVVWFELERGVFDNQLQRAILHHEDQQLIGTFAAMAGAQSFAAEIAQPPASVRRALLPCAVGENTKAFASLVAYVDSNGNGILDLYSPMNGLGPPGSPIDHVVSSSEFPTVILGDQRLHRVLEFNEVCSAPSFLPLTASQPLYEHALMDLTSCASETRFSFPRACSSTAVTNAIWFTGIRRDDDVGIQLDSHTQVTVLVDGETRGLAIPETGGLTIALNSLGVGQHSVRAENVDGVVWEATFTFPDRTWIRSARPSAAGKYEVSFQEITGATTYELVGTGQSGETVEGTSSPLHLRAQTSLMLTARFGELPFSVIASESLDR